jgi:hypothetical protein
MERIEPAMAVEKNPAFANREAFLERVLNSLPLAASRRPRKSLVEASWH